MTGLLAIIPARAGSKGVPGKNKALINGLPLIEYTVAAAKSARSVTGIVITTDDPDILAYYRDREGVFTVERPPALAQDDSKTSAAVMHALASWEKSGRRTPPALFLAQPTTPLRTADDIDAAYELFEQNGHEPVLSACRVEGIRHPRVMYTFENGRGALYIDDNRERLRRQDQELLYQRNGAIYLVSNEFFRHNLSFRNRTPFIYEMPWARSINIDGPGDLLIAKALIESGLLDTDKTNR
ncbi:MAG: cytidylyltransferase domain-containing protein [Gammaproteobacteria bacterium]